MKIKRRKKAPRELRELFGTNKLMLIEFDKEAKLYDFMAKFSGLGFLEISNLRNGYGLAWIGNGVILSTGFFQNIGGKKILRYLSTKKFARNYGLASTIVKVEDPDLIYSTPKAKKFFNKLGYVKYRESKREGVSTIIMRRKK